MKKHVLITGATGFVGRLLTLRAIQEGWFVRGTIQAHKPSCVTHPDMETVSIEPLGPATLWAHALKDITTVVHLAARVHVMHETASDPLTQFRITNTEGTARLATEAAAAGVKRFIFVSTIGVNGAATDSNAYTENDEPAPHNPYSVSKFEAERRLHSIAAETGMEVVIIRAPLVYGPGNPGNILRLLHILAKGIPLPFASVHNRRSFLYIGNLVDALIVCVSHPAAGRIYLVSDGEDISTPELIGRAAAALNVPARVFPFPVSLLRMAGRLTGKEAAARQLVDSLVVNSSKIRRELGWTPPFTMREGLQATGEWYHRTYGEKR